MLEGKIGIRGSLDLRGEETNIVFSVKMVRQILKDEVAKLEKWFKAGSHFEFRKS